MARKTKPTEQPKAVFTPANSGVNEILEELVDWILSRSDENLRLEKVYKPTLEEEIQIQAWLEQDKLPKENYEQ